MLLFFFCSCFLFVFLKGTIDMSFLKDTLYVYMYVQIYVYKKTKRIILLLFVFFKVTIGMSFLKDSLYVYCIKNYLFYIFY